MTMKSPLTLPVVLSMSLVCVTIACTGCVSAESRQKNNIRRDVEAIGGEMQISDGKTGSEPQGMVSIYVFGKKIKESSILEWMKCPGLGCVYMEHCDFDVSHALSSLSGNTEIIQLSLSGASFTDKHVKDLPPSKHLELWVSFTSLSDTGLHELVALKGLRKLVAEQTDVTKPGVDEFLKKRPDVHVLFSTAGSAAARDGQNFLIKQGAGVTPVTRIDEHPELKLDPAISSIIRFSQNNWKPTPEGERALEVVARDSALSAIVKSSSDVAYRNKEVMKNVYEIQIEEKAWNSLEDEVWVGEDFEPLGTMERCRSVRVEGVAVTVSLIQNLAKCQSLRLLTIHGTTCPPEALAELSSLSQVESLEFHLDDYQSQSLDPIQKMKNLKKLSLLRVGKNLSAAAIEDLQTARPELKINK